MLSDEQGNTLSNFKKTREVLIFRKALGIETRQKVLIIIKSSNQNLLLATKNLKNTKLILTSNLNVKDLLHADHLIFDQPTFNNILSLYDKTKINAYNN